MVPWLYRPSEFPDPRTARRRPDGLLAAGGALTPDWLLAAYRRGIFPWFGEGEPILWWSPDPRMTLDPARVHISHSLKKTLRRGTFELRLDTAFADVMRACAAPRVGQPGTWILPAMVEAYSELHALGYAHSVESWRDGELVGGLYGVCIGGMFFGESMFARQTDASKVALARLCELLPAKGIEWIDCQQVTPHLAYMGGQSMARRDFLLRLNQLVNKPVPPCRWSQP